MDERVFQKLGFDKLRERLCGLTFSEPGAQLARELQPSADREAVAALLAETEHDIGEIAGMVGFNNISYYNKMFRKYMHMTPKEYRAAARRTEEH